MFFGLIYYWKYSFKSILGGKTSKFFPAGPFFCLSYTKRLSNCHYFKKPPLSPKTSVCTPVMKNSTFWSFYHAYPTDVSFFKLHFLKPFKRVLNFVLTKYLISTLVFQGQPWESARNFLIEVFCCSFLVPISFLVRHNFFTFPFWRFIFITSKREICQNVRIKHSFHVFPTRLRKK